MHSVAKAALEKLESCVNGVGIKSVLPGQFAEIRRLRENIQYHEFLSLGLIMVGIVFLVTLLIHVGVTSSLLGMFLLTSIVAQRIHLQTLRWRLRGAIAREVVGWTALAGLLWWAYRKTRPPLESAGAALPAIVSLFNGSSLRDFLVLMSLKRIVDQYVELIPFERWTGNPWHFLSALRHLGQPLSRLDSLRAFIGEHWPSSKVTKLVLMNLLGAVGSCGILWLLQQPAKNLEGRKKGRNKGGKGTKIRAAGRTLRSNPKGSSAAPKPTVQSKFSFIYDHEQYEFEDVNGSYRAMSGENLKQHIRNMAAEMDEDDHFVYYKKNGDIQHILYRGDVHAGWGLESALGKAPYASKKLPFLQVGSNGWALPVRDKVITLRHLWTSSVMTVRANDIVTAQVSKKDLVTLAGDLVYFPKSKFQVQPPSARYVLDVPKAAMEGLVINGEEFSVGLVGLDEHQCYTQPGWCGSAVTQTHTGSVRVVGMHQTGDTGSGTNGFIPFTHEIIEQINANGD